MRRGGSTDFLKELQVMTLGGVYSATKISRRKSGGRRSNASAQAGELGPAPREFPPFAPKSLKINIGMVVCLSCSGGVFQADPSLHFPSRDRQLKTTFAPPGPVSNARLPTLARRRHCWFLRPDRYLLQCKIGLL